MVEIRILRGADVQAANGTKVGRTSANDVTLYKSLGIAPQDLASAHYVLQKARERGVGQVIDFCSGTTWP